MLILTGKYIFIVNGQIIYGKAIVKMTSDPKIVPIVSIFCFHISVA